MFSHEFLVQIAATYGLTSDQKLVFLKRFLENKAHQEIANDLSISVSAGLRRMAEVYKKFNIAGKSRGKDNELRKFLINQLEQNYNSNELNLKIDERIGSLSNRIKNVEKVTSKDKKSYKNICHNLPAKTSNFIGRKDELEKIIKYLSKEHVSPIIEVDGIGGIGKTELVLEVAYKFLETKEISDRFDAIIFVSAKENYLLPVGILKRLDTNTYKTLDDICKEISSTLNEESITRITHGKNQCDLVKRSLNKKRTLLILDNLETLDSEERNKVISFLKDLPSTVKSIITTREQSVIHVDIRLKELSEKDSLELIKQQVQEKSVSLTNEEFNQLYQVSGGVPLVIVYAIGRLSNSLNIETVIKDLKSANGDLAEFLFKKSIKEIDKNAYNLLISLAIFKESPLQNALIEVSGLKTSQRAALSGLEKLQQLSIVTKKDGRYKMLSPTREYALAELGNNQNFEEEARKRWLNWYLEFAQKYGGDDSGEWHHEYDKIKEEWGNFQEVLAWCASQNEYLKVKHLWDCLNKCANLYGYWDDRLTWLSWLIEESHRKKDLATLVEANTAYSWTLILQESPEHLVEADKYQKEAWKMRQHANPVVQCVLAENIAVLNIRQRKYEEAFEWIKKSKELLTKSDLDDLQNQRSEMRCLYYEAEILYRQKDYDKAKSLYQKVVEQAEKINWLRFIINAQSWLATIAIKQDRLDEAERLLNICLPVAERNHDKRRTACCQFSFARLEKARGKIEKAREWAMQALDSFERLGVIRDADEIRSFLEKLHA